jgi:hypothetical protein
MVRRPDRGPPPAGRGIPSIALKQPVDKATADEFDSLVAKLLERVANRDARPRWKDSSFFKRFGG